ncbi:hypothetical protein [Microbacterium sp. SSM24]|uniref:hypothetical protein n=1 Tax=Microbacterium sp. SSM24 TaxID=2991714 RepID=UPI002227CA58|nr:hypothetical protein [Microbacterium sp. SSM24]MCW3494702.1 hypothetical protein [Microbacterium sp. SSM24]
MTDEDAPLSRREWRDKHKPPILRGDPVFNLASWLIPIASVAMFPASLGGRSSRFRATPDESAVWVVMCAAVIGVLLVAITVRLVLKRGQPPLSFAGAVFVVVVSLLSMVVVLARNEGVFSTPILVMFSTNAVCLIAGFVALAVSAVRRRERRAPG